MKINPYIVKASARYVSTYFSTYLDTNFTYHNIVHTTYVAKAVHTLCCDMNISAHQNRILSVSAWFHDLGFTQCIEGHEEAGAELAGNFLESKGIDQEDIATVKACILSTHYPQQPTKLLEKIICDADLMYLGDKCYLKTSALLRKEWELTKAITYTDSEWYQLNIQFVSAHHFHTRYCLTHIEKKKTKNVRLLENMLRSNSKEKTECGLEEALVACKQGKGSKGRLTKVVENLLNSSCNSHMKFAVLSSIK
jgi:predicted metal-dependent HD superfamily phosphohydrolase